jgi:hypothetical protein
VGAGGKNSSLKEESCPVLTALITNLSLTKLNNIPDPGCKYPEMDRLKFIISDVL